MPCVSVGGAKTWQRKSILIVWSHAEFGQVCQVSPSPHFWNLSLPPVCPQPGQMMFAWQSLEKYARQKDRPLEDSPCLLSLSLPSQYCKWFEKETDYANPKNKHWTKGSFGSAAGVCFSSSPLFFSKLFDWPGIRVKHQVAWETCKFFKLPIPKLLQSKMHLTKKMCWFELAFCARGPDFFLIMSFNSCSWSPETPGLPMLTMFSNKHSVSNEMQCTAHV